MLYFDALVIIIVDTSAAASKIKANVHTDSETYPGVCGDKPN